MSCATPWPCSYWPARLLSGRCEPLIRSSPVPVDCLNIVLCDPLAVLIQVPEIELGSGMPLLSRLSKPSCGLTVVLCEPLTLIVLSSDFMLRLSVAGFRSRT